MADETLTKALKKWQEEAAAAEAKAATLAGTLGKVESAMKSLSESMYSGEGGFDTFISMTGDIGEALAGIPLKMAGMSNGIPGLEDMSSAFSKIGDAIKTVSRGMQEAEET